MGTWGEAYITRMRGCAARLGRELVEVSNRDRAVRLLECSARLVEEGFSDGLLSVASDGGVRTLDPRQTTTWMVSGDPARPRWEVLSQLAAYVELVAAAGYPDGAVRFATSRAELGLDLAAVNDDGQVVLLGVARSEPLELSKVEALVPTFEVSVLCEREVSGRDPQRIAYQLWATRAPYLWLVAAGTRRLFRVRYDRTIRLSPIKVLPMPDELWPLGFRGPTPRVVPVVPVVSDAADAPVASDATVG